MKTWFVTYQYEDSYAQEVKGHRFFTADHAEALEVKLDAFEQTLQKSNHALRGSFLLTLVNQI